MSSTTTPVPVEDHQGDGRWMSMHKRFLIETNEKEPDVLFIGDSLIQRLVHTEMWNKCFAPMHALNFGIGGDQVQNVLWRVENGTNNFGFSSEEIADGILELVRVIREKQPVAYIVVLCEIVAIDKGFIQPDGTISHHDMHDYLHLTNSGYEKAFEPVHDLLMQLLTEGEPEKDLTPSE
ncbi:Platelet-activating factor acetylhydrolase IB subunit beta [Blattella germanica]|nr:Platelet-activating factor acetylhydrolase IB subunit beta [Blattella germanica]